MEMWDKNFIRVTLLGNVLRVDKGLRFGIYELPSYPTKEEENMKINKEIEKLLSEE